MLNVECWLFFLFFLFLNFSSSALDFVPPYKARFWMLEENPFRNMVQAIAQTPDGFLWIGTQDGLARFDGVRFEFFRVGTSIDPLSQRINALYADKDGSLWAGTPLGIFRFKDHQWINYPTPPGVEKPILSLLGTQNGDVWAGARVGLTHLENGKFILVGNTNTNNASLAERNTAVQVIRSIAQRENGELWVSAGGHLVQMKNGMHAENHNLLAFRPDFIRAVVCRRDGSVWAGTHAGLIQLKDGEFTRFTRTNGLPDNMVTSLYEDRRGNLWVGTFGGLCRFVNGKFVVEARSEAESYDQIFAFFEDREDNLWVGAKDGLYQLNVQAFTSLTTVHGLAHNNVTSVYEDKEGAMWVGTWGGGLHRLQDGRWTIYSTTNSPSMVNDTILALTRARDGSIWFGEDYEGGLYQMKNGQFQHFGKDQGLGRSAIRALLEDRTGKLWIGHGSAGFGYVDKNRVRFYGTKHGLPSQLVRCLLEDRNGKIWIGTEKGLVCWENKKFQTYSTTNGLSDDFIMSLYEDQDRALWIGTGKGLSRRSEGHFRHYTAKRGLFDDVILEILEDEFGSLWLASRRGVFRIRKKDLEDFDAHRISKIPFTVFGMADGMGSQICVSVAKPAAVKSSDGRLWFATTKGVAVTDPKLQIAKNEKPPPVVIQRVLADKQLFDVAHSNANSSLPPQTLNFKPGRGELEIHYTALSYTAPEKNRFKYKLEGFDSDWVDADTRKIAFYNNTPPGNYVFRVIASNSDGVWNAVGSSIKFSLQPHFWQTFWFRGLCVVAAIGIVGGIARYVTRKKLQGRLLRLEQQHALDKERTRIAQDMHDDLGACLTEILMITDQGQKNKSDTGKVEHSFTKISGTAREMVDNLDALVWTVNPKNDLLDRTFTYLFEFTQSFLESAGVSCRFEVPGKLPSLPLSSEVRHNLFLVVKEALNNAVKHAQAKDVWIRMKMENGGVIMVIEDNGKGFTTSETDTFGNGLHNMRKRIETIGGHFELCSEKGKGTRIQFEIPLRR